MPTLLRRARRVLPPLSIAAVVCALPGVSAAACYTMIDARNAVVYQSRTSPIDLSRSIATEMARRFPSRSLVISTSDGCVEIDPVAMNAGRSRASRGPAPDPASLLRGTPDANRYDGPYLDTSPTPVGSDAGTYLPDVGADRFGVGRSGDVIVQPQGLAMPQSTAAPAPAPQGARIR